MTRLFTAVKNTSVKDVWDLSPPAFILNLVSVKTCQLPPAIINQTQLVTLTGFPCSVLISTSTSSSSSSSSSPSFKLRNVLFFLLFWVYRGWRPRIPVAVCRPVLWCSLIVFRIEYNGNIRTLLLLLNQLTSLEFTAIFSARKGRKRVARRLKTNS